MKKNIRGNNSRGEGVCANYIALLALATTILFASLPARADFYWLLSGDLKWNANARSDITGFEGGGCWLELTNDTAGVEFKPVKIWDIRRTTSGGTTIAKHPGGASHRPFDGCRLGEAVVDLTLPIRGADGAEYTFGGIANSGFASHNYIGKLVLCPTIAFINERGIYNMAYLREVVMPDPAEWRPTYLYRSLEGCPRMKSAIRYPDNYGDLSNWNFSGNSAMAGFYGAGVTNFHTGCFNGIPASFRLEIGEADELHFKGSILDSSNLSRVIWHSMPPSTGDAFSTGDKNFMSRGHSGRIHYIPYDPTQEGGVPARWATYKPAFEAETSGNSLTFPVYDPETGTQTDGKWYLNGKSGSADKVRFWFPGTTSALLMK